MNRRIKNAYDAWRFLYDHPKFMIPERVEVRDEEHARTINDGQNPITKRPWERPMWRIEMDKGGNRWALSTSLYRRALEENLDIHYTKTNKPGGHGRVDDNKAKNKHIECWLEFGPIYYGYATDWEWKDHDRSYMEHVHDYRLDDGGTTFDEALVNLAKNVLKFYGDYKDKKRLLSLKDVCLN